MSLLLLFCIDYHEINISNESIAQTLINYVEVYGKNEYSTSECC